jgi:hypothetical protein
MKSIYKKISVGLVALAFVAVAGYGVKNSMNSDIQLSNLTKANVEALASGEVQPCYGFGSVLCSYNNIWVSRQG